VGGNDVSGVAVQGGAGTVVAHRGAWISVRSGFLDVSQRDPGIKCGDDECMPQCVRRDGFADPGPAGDAADDPPGAVPVQAATVGVEEDRPFYALADGQVDRPGCARRERDRHDLAALAGDHERPVTALHAQRLDIRAGGLGHPQAVERQQRDQRVLGRRAEPGSDQESAEFVAVQRGGMRLVIQPRPPDMRSGNLTVNRSSRLHQVTSSVTW